MTHDEMIAVIQAHKDGKVIQARLGGGGSEWKRNNAPQWNFLSAEYRVKPMPKEYWLVPYTYKNGLAVFYNCPRSVGSLGAGTGFDLSGTIHVVTVVEHE
jgi:hypothetical protein